MSKDHKTILLVEDNPGDSRLIQELLSKVTTSQTVLVVADRLSTGLEALEREKADVVLLDLGLPDSQGLDTLARAHAKAPSTPIVVLTGLDDEATGRKAIAKGAQDYVIKGTVSGKMLWRIIHYAIGRKHLEDDIQSQYAVLTSILESHYTPVFSVGKNYCYTSFNSSHAAVMKSLYGVDIELGRSLLDYMTVTEDRKTAKKNLDRALKGEHLTEEAYSGEESLNRRYFEISHNPVTGPDGKVLGVSVFANDLTERKRAEDDLRRSEEKYRALFEKSKDPIYITTREGRFLDMNQSMLELFGYTRNEMLELDVHKIYAVTVDREKFQQELAEKGFASDYEVKFVKKDGKVIDCMVTATVWRSDDRTILGYQGTIRDMTERIEMEQALRQSEERYRTILEDMKDSYFETDIAGNFTFVNDSTCLNVGYSRAELLGMTYHSIVATEDVDSANQAYSRVHQTGEPIRDLNLRFVNKRGAIRFWENSVFPLRNDEGEFTGFRVVGHDITERIRIERQREMSLAIMSLLTRSGDKTELIGNILKYIKDFSDCEAVGIRLQQGDDYPYYVHNGFVPGHIEVENKLCALNENGEIMRDPQGNPVLEYMCGNIIRGRFDPTKPFFTEGGSCWTNSTTELLASTTDDDRLGCTRNRCHSEGYESVALIPLKGEDGNIGLLQLNDSRRNRFTVDLIEYYEGIAQSIGIVMARQNARERLEHSTRRLQQSLMDTVSGIATIVEMRDPYTAGHQIRVAKLACALAAEMGLSAEIIANIQTGGTLHDIGKMHVPAEILSKPGKLSEIEFMMIKNHPQIGYDIVKKIDFPCAVAQMAIQHHERIDGSGYPGGLKGDDIILEAKILAVADVIEAMASHRPYRPALGIDKALEEITTNKGKLYDADVVDACLRLFKEKGFKFE